MKIALCMPVYDHPKAQFTMSALAMQAHTFKVRSDIELQGHMKHGHSRIEDAREELAGSALAGGADALLWLDDDHSFPPDSLVRLLAHDLPFVGVNYRRRDPSKNEGVAWRSTGITRRQTALRPQGEGLEAASLMGFGLVLIRAAVFNAIPRPWFKWGPQGEDGYFCEQAIKHGYHPHVDHALSMEVGHIAETVLRFPA